MMNWFNRFFSYSNSKAENKGTQKPQYTAIDYCERGQKSLDAERYVEAMEFFQAALEADSHFEKAYLLLATAYVRQGKNDKAKATLYSLLAIDPNNAEAKRRVHGEIEKQNIVLAKTNAIIKIDNPKSTSRNLGEITFLMVKVLFAALCAVWFILLIIKAIEIDASFDGDTILGLICFNYFPCFIVYRFLHLMLYRRDNYEGDKYGEGKYNPIVYRPVRNIIFIVILFIGIIALFYAVNPFG